MCGERNRGIPGGGLRLWVKRDGGWMPGVGGLGFDWRGEGKNVGVNGVGRGGGPMFRLEPV